MERIELGRYRVAATELFYGESGVTVKLGKFLALAAEVATFGYFNEFSKGNDVTAKLYFEKWKINNPGEVGFGTEEELFNQYKKARITQLKAAAMEARIIVMFALACLLVGFGFDQWDEDRNNPIIKQMKKLMEKVQLELGFFVIPTEMSKIVSRGPIPAWQTVDNLFKLMTNTVGETKDLMLGTSQNKLTDINPLSKDFLEEKRDASPRFKYMFKLMPFLKQLDNLTEFTGTTDDNQENTFWGWMSSTNNNNDSNITN